MALEENTATPTLQHDEPVKSANLWNRFKDWMARTDRRQMEDSYLPEHDETNHTCVHCGTQYTGRSCPQCTMPARWNRFTWKLLILNFLDIWGLGNRPMFRTFRDLFWRPGYMMRDYLNGHHLSYFPPFKMLAVLTIIMIMLGYVLNVQLTQSQLMADAFEAALNNSEIHTTNHTQAFSYFKQCELFIQDHLLYRILLQNVVIVIAVWLVFRRKSKLNLVETAFSQIYINCQFLIIGIILMLLMWCFSIGVFSPDVPLDSRHFLVGSGFPYAMPGGIGSVAIIALVLAYDFHQLYGLNWRSTIWRTVAVTLLVYSIFLSFALTTLFMFVNTWMTLMTLVLLALMGYAGIYLPIKYIRNNRAWLSKPVYRASLCSLCLVVFMHTFWISATVQGYSIILAIVFSILAMASMAGMSMLMVSLYKKHQKAWMSFLVLALMPLVYCLEVYLFLVLI